MEYELLSNKKKRIKNNKEKLRIELITYITNELKIGHYPSRREIENEFHLKLDTYFSDINSLYKKVGIKYKLQANQNLKSTKANLLLKTVLNNLNKFNMKLILYRKIQERGIDMIAKENNNVVGIEIKAYKESERLKMRDINQVLRFIEKEHLDKAIIITTTDKKDNFKVSEKIKIIMYNELIKILKIKNNKNLNFIRNHSVNVEDSLKNIKRQKILDYVKEKYIKEDKKSNWKDISKDLHLDIYTYFEDLFEIYKTLKILPPTKNMRGMRAKNPDVEIIRLFKEEFKKHILEEIKKGNKYPSGDEIGKHFGISNIWNIVKTSDLYKELNIKPYLEREKRFTCVQES